MGSCFKKQKTGEIQENETQNKIQVQLKDDNNNENKGVED